MALEGLSKGIFRSLGVLKSRRRIDEDELREMTRSLRRALQEADFNVRQTKEIVEKLESRMRKRSLDPELICKLMQLTSSTLRWLDYWVLLTISDHMVRPSYWLVCTVKVRQLPLQN